ncbi:NAD(P)-dependent dehydrogenase (short-subunit alcohol dehydrogenase family) [Saonia flava]|uniref:NAD(P)-dependent dehydrogenase (Short-subunit alcohol dehydrogenase family) n=1 Tax=Saonia flava TaxID=523696 RepID=A0A846QNI8_9FLAO|nr:SDR family oxidoreductase [Saonia flava]NJB70616.1 NAD(P)-dependent dehydrogenase (short-subunit alcohol dehydrogenase family) [Saonia flava]
MISLNDKTALVTGANRGIGKEIVNSFLAHGAKKVYLAVRNLESTIELEQKYGNKVVSVYLDLSIPETVAELAKEVQDVDVVVNNAGVLTLTSPLDANVETVFKKELEVNVFGLLRMARAFTPALERNGGGVFVQINSIASIIGGKTFGTYSASKAASYSFTQSLKECMKPKNIRVISVHPGPIDTDMGAEAGMKDIAEPATVVSEGIIKALENGSFHVFPDKMAKEFGKDYMPYAEKYIEIN